MKEKLLALDGVSGVSEKEGRIVVYLAEDSPEVREKVRAIAGDVPMVVIGAMTTSGNGETD
jgi:hypothetical protein